MGDWERGRIKMMDTEKKKKKLPSIAQLYSAGDIHMTFSCSLVLWLRVFFRRRSRWERFG